MKVIDLEVLDVARAILMGQLGQFSKGVRHVNGASVVHFIEVVSSAAHLTLRFCSVSESGRSGEDQLSIR